MAKDSTPHYRVPAPSAEEFIPRKNFQLIKHHPEYKARKGNKRRWAYNKDGSVFQWPYGEGDTLKKKFCRKFLKESRETAIDIGAHIGDWSRWMLSQRFKKVIAFEPQPIWREAFIHNVDMTNTVLYPYALSDENNNVSMNHMILADNQDGPYKARTLDSLDIKEKIDFIKIDIEGWELHALRGARETLLKNKPVLIVEQKGESGRKKAGRKKGLVKPPNRITKYLLKIGYREAGIIRRDHVYKWR